MKFARNRPQERMFDVAIVPLIDVVFFLITFFMVTARFAEANRADLQLPVEPGEASASREQDGLVINLTGGGEVIILGRAVEWDELEQIVSDQAKTAPGGDPAAVRVVLRADRGAAAAQLNRVIALLSSHGVGAARLATEIPSTEGRESP
jgi:biopolymer transport protein ExbD